MHATKLICKNSVNNRIGEIEHGLLDFTAGDSRPLGTHRHHVCQTFKPQKYGILVISSLAIAIDLALSIIHMMLLVRVYLRSIA